MPEPSPRHVFVYGTLRRGERNDITRLAPAPRFVGEASVPGTLHVVSWYPGLVLGGERPVKGEVYEISPELERRLDEIEEVYPEPTGEYSKRMLRVRVRGRDVDCVVYEIASDRVIGRPVIDSGDWLDRP